MPEAVVGTRSFAVTEWFDARSRPVHEGVYERLFPAGPYSCWNGASWNADASDPTAAARQPRPSAWQDARWRGLLEASAEPCATCRGHTVVDRGFDEDSGEDLIAECVDC